MSACVLAIDVGGTTIKGSVVDETGRSHHLQSRPSLEGTDALAVLKEMLDSLTADADASGLHLVGAGIVTPGVVDVVAGRIGFASNLGWRDLDLRADLQAHLKVPVAIGHDVRAAGAAEALLGSARGAEDFVFIAVGTGIAAALVTGGHPVIGVGNGAGEIGHMPVHPRGERCSCGQRGCLEVYASGAAIARRYHDHGGRDARTAEDVVARLGVDPVADKVWSDAVDALALGSSTMTMTLDPALIVLGGGLARAGETLLGPLRAALGQLLTWRPPPPIELCVLGSVAGRIGAAIRAFGTVGMGETVANWTAESVLAVRP